MDELDEGLPPRTRTRKFILALDRVVGTRRDIAEEEAFDYAPWLRRIAALVLDAIIVFPLLTLAYGFWVDGLGLPEPKTLKAGHLYDGQVLSIIALNLMGPALFDLIYTLACRVPMTLGMHVARLGIADTEDLGSQPTRMQLLVRWLVKWGAIALFLPVSAILAFIWVLFVPTRRGLHEMASHTITYRRPIWNRAGGESPAPAEPRGQKRALPYISRSRR